jgi:uncharacterized protein
MLGAAATGAATLGAANAFAVEPRFSLVVKEWDIAHPAWPTGAAPLRIGILTDIHAVEPWMNARRIAGIAARMNALKPDMVVLLGDYVNALRPGYYSKVVPVADWVSALSSLRAPLGVYAVLGNHDWSSGEAPAIRRAFYKAGIALLENRAVKIARGQSHFWVAGLNDQLNGTSRGVVDMSATLAHVTDPAPIVLLAHEPDVISYVPPRVTLTLAGHTHGGQVYIPFIGRPSLTGGGGMYAKYAHGHIVENGRHLVVSSGLGVTAYPVRFLVPPEIAIVTLGAPANREKSQSSFNS